MVVTLGLRVHAGLGTDDVRNDAAVGGVADAKVAILEERAQAVVLELGGIGVADGKLVAVFHDRLLLTIRLKTL